MLAAPTFDPTFDWTPLTGGERWCHAAFEGLTAAGVILRVRNGETWHGRAFGRELAVEHPGKTRETQVMVWVEEQLTAKLAEMMAERDTNAPVDAKSIGGAAALGASINFNVPCVLTLPDGRKIEIPAGSTAVEGMLPGSPR